MFVNTPRYSEVLLAVLYRSSLFACHVYNRKVKDPQKSTNNKRVDVSLFVRCHMFTSIIVLYFRQVRHTPVLAGSNSGEANNNTCGRGVGAESGEIGGMDKTWRCIVISEG
jgi:hypothetical protein